MSSSAIHNQNRFILSKEMTVMVFKFLLLGNARAALAQCSRVSKSWHTIAITVLWAHINLDWFRSLVRFERTADGIYESTLSTIGDPTPGNWDLFSKFAKETTSLDFSWKGRLCDLDISFLDELAYFRDDQPIFPKLNSLRTGIKSFVISLYPRSLTKLSLNFGFLPVDDYILHRASRSLSFAGHRFQNLTTLDIRSTTVLEHPSFASALEDCLMQWDSLIEFCCPLYFLRDQELRILGRYPCLSRVTVDIDGARRGFWMSEDRIRTHDRVYLNSLAFRQLRFLELGTTGLPTLISFISPLHLLLSRLEKLWVRAPYPHQCQPSQLYDLLELLSDHSPNLRRLTLHLSASHTWDHNTADEIGAVEWRHLQPLTRMRLEVVDISHTFPFLITDADIGELAETQPQAISIALNPQPVFVQSSNLTFAAIEAFARFCPRLQTLAIYIDAQAVIPQTLPASHFESLKHLRMGHSSILDGNIQDCESWRRLVVFFYHILPATTKIWSTYYDRERDILDGFTFIGQPHHPYDLYTYGRRWKYLFLCTRVIPLDMDEYERIHGVSE